MSSPPPSGDPIHVSERLGNCAFTRADARPRSAVIRPAPGLIGGGLTRGLITALQSKVIAVSAVGCPAPLDISIHSARWVGFPQTSWRDGWMGIRARLIITLPFRLSRPLSKRRLVKHKSSLANVYVSDVDYWRNICVLSNQ